MKKIKTQRGITLVALIITIVVLLILAAVAISSIQNDGILLYAKNAADGYTQAQLNETSILDNYSAFLNTNSNINTKKEIEFTVNQITYKALEDMKWSEWCESAYNTAQAYVDSNDYVWMQQELIGIFKVVTTEFQYVSGTNEIKARW